MTEFDFIPGDIIRLRESIDLCCGETLPAGARATVVETQPHAIYPNARMLTVEWHDETDAQTAVWSASRFERVYQDDWHTGTAKPSEAGRTEPRKPDDPFPVGSRVRIVKSQWDHDPVGTTGTVAPCPAHENGSPIRSVLLDLEDDYEAGRVDDGGAPMGGWAYLTSDLEAIEDETPEGSRGDALANGERMEEYGHPKVSFDRIASMWSSYLSAPEVEPEALTGEDVGHLMLLLKISRSITDKKPDTLDDVEGYVSCIRMIREATSG